MQTTEGLNDEQLQVLFFQHKRKIKALTASRKIAADAVTEAFALAKAEGISKKEIELALALETDEGKKKLEAERARQERVARWMGEALGSQGDLVGDAHHDAGKRAAMSDELRKPPKHLHQRDAQSWLEGFDEGVQAMNAQRQSGFKQLGDQASSATVN